MRLKLIAGNLAIVLLVGLGSYFVVRTQLRAELVRELENRIGDDGFGFSFAMKTLAGKPALLEADAGQESSWDRR